MATDIEKIKRKIAALLAKAEGTDNEHEAATFAEKAQQMLEEYQISIFELGDEDDKMGVYAAMTGTSSTATWKRHLIGGLGLLYGCKVVRAHKGNDKWELQVIGRESSRITTELMIPFIFKQCRDAGARLAKEGHGTADFCTRRVANALTPRIYQMIEAEKEKVHSAKHNSRELVVVEELKAYVDELFPKLKQGIGRTRSTTEAARAEAGKISLNRQMGGRSGALRIAG